MYKRKDGLYEHQIIINGKRKSFSGKSDKDVTRKILNYQGEVEKGRLFKSVAELWKEEHFKSIAYNSTKNYNPAYKRAVAEFDNRYIKTIKPNDINAFIKSFAQEGFAQKTVSTQLLVLSLIFDFAVLCGDIEYNPCSTVTIPKNLPKSKRNMPSKEDMQKVKNSINCTFGLFAYFLLYTGCRKGEALALQHKDIDRANKLIKIYKSVYHINNKPSIKQPKTEAGKREIILLDDLEKILPKGKDKDYIFHNMDNGLLTETQFQRQWELYCKETGLNITPHQLRHAFATILFECGVDEKDAQDLLGHSSIIMTRDIYTHISRSRKEETAKKLNAFKL